MTRSCLGRSTISLDLVFVERDRFGGMVKGQEPDGELRDNVGNTDVFWGFKGLNSLNNGR